ncbi:MAG TPA: hypothetical protein DCP90_03375 [Clostridiales bacterium]|nr:MAG: hypothetical protein A2Y22_03025 [Clostridiales bacterium GWD2_32_59]HAN09637.1 hypothetical protein [Clostridiales bacterium]
MRKTDTMERIFNENNGIVQTSVLKEAGVTSRQIAKLVEDGVIAKIKHGYYEYTEHNVDEKVIISKLFPDAIMCLHSALYIYEYTDRVPSYWQLAVDKSTEGSKYNITYPRVKPVYVSKTYLNIGATMHETNGVRFKIYDKERTICDCLRYINKMDTEVFNKAIKAYISDSDRNIGKLIEYGKLLRVSKKIKTYVEVWL